MFRCQNELIILLFITNNGYGFNIFIFKNNIIHIFITKYYSIKILIFIHSISISYTSLLVIITPCTFSIFAHKIFTILFNTFLSIILMLKS
nr:MAG TPA: hypothetical protein [Bacteriophage sp.]